MDFVTHGGANIDLSVADDITSPRVISEIEQGTYEDREMKFARNVIQDGDRVLELGAGLGFVSTVVCGSKKPAYFAAVEADARLIPHIRRTHEKNGVTGVEVINAAFVADRDTLDRGHVEVGVTSVFWGSGINKAGDNNVTTVRVDVQDASRFIREKKINVLVSDIEGGELDLFRHLDFGPIRKIIIEVHPRVFGPEGVREVFRILDDNDFVYDAPNSSGPVITFRKQKPFPRIFGRRKWPFGRR
jgi:FkbM family methyltransferase